MISPMTAARAAVLGTLRHHLGEAGFGYLKDRMGVSALNRMADDVLDSVSRAFLMRLMRDHIPSEPEPQADVPNQGWSLDRD